MRNEMMHRPVVKEELLDFMRTQQKLPGELGKLEEEAHVAEVPVIPHETVVFLKFYLDSFSLNESWRSEQLSVFIKCHGHDNRRKRSCYDN